MSIRVFIVLRFQQKRDLKNKLGKEKAIVVSSQMGIPIGVYQGKEVFVTVPSELPKMTRLNINYTSLK